MGHCKDALAINNTRCIETKQSMKPPRFARDSLELLREAMVRGGRADWGGLAEIASALWASQWRRLLRLFASSLRSSQWRTMAMTA